MSCGLEVGSEVGGMMVTSAGLYVSSAVWLIMTVGVAVYHWQGISTMLSCTSACCDSDMPAGVSIDAVVGPQRRWSAMHEQSAEQAETGWAALQVRDALPENSGLLAVIASRRLSSSGDLGPLGFANFLKT